jgi:7-carboxy-7-deazaguanine synthase
MKVANIFLSIDGEVNSFGQGGFTTFIRFAGCNFLLNNKDFMPCFYCDTKWAQDEAFTIEMSIDTIIQKVKDFDCPKVTITGGEPLLQKDIAELIDKLKDNGFDISIETNGTILFPDNYDKVDCWVMDCKLQCLPLKYNMEILRFSDFIKIVVWDNESYETAKRIIEKYSYLGYPQWALSAVVSNKLSHAELIKWMKEDKLFSVRVNIQIHKLIYPIENTSKFPKKEY